MRLIVVYSEMMSGKEACAVFADTDKAKQYISARPGECLKSGEFHVNGKSEFPDVVFAAHKYEPRGDVFLFQGLYGSYEQAEKVAGRLSGVREFKVQ